MESEILTIHHELVTRQRSCYEIINDELSCVGQHDSLLLAEDALVSASAIDRKIASGEPLGLLEGIPFGIQDMLLLQNTIVTGGSDFLQNYRSPYTATAIQQLLDAGAIPVVKEPCDCLEHHTGSLGASDEAKEITAFSIGDDDGGSIRQSAGYNKMYGLKPTFGRVSRWGSMSASSTSCISPMASSLEDIRIILNAISGKDSNDVSTFASGPISERVFNANYLNRNIKIGYYQSFIENDVVEDDVKTNFQQMIDRLSSIGIQIVPLDFFDINILVSTFYVLSMAETASNLAKLDGTVYGRREFAAQPNDDRAVQFNDDGAPKHIREGSYPTKNSSMMLRAAYLPEETKRRIIAGSRLLSHGYDIDVWLKAQQLKAAIIGKMNESFENVDIILSPVTITPVSPNQRAATFNFEQIHPELFSTYMQDAFTVAFSLGGLPTLSVPFFLPAGIQITANKNREDLILHVAKLLKDRQ